MKYRFFVLLSVLLTGLSCVVAYASDKEWEFTPEGLPYLKFDRFASSEEDPSYLLGNYRIKVNAHASGIYELISGERIWGRFNADPTKADYGRNMAVAEVDGREIRLIGEGSLAENPGKCDFYAGPGFARYDYDLGDGLKCSRMISVMPSETVNGGNPLFLVTIKFSNTGSAARKIAYDEAVAPCYIPASYQNLPENERPLKYLMNTEIAFRYMKASFTPMVQKWVPYASAGVRALDEFSPQSIFLYCGDAFLVVNNGQLKASITEFKLRPRKQKTLYVVIGLAGEEDCKEMAERVIDKAEDNEFGAFAGMWKKHLPDLSSERIKEVRAEMYDRAHKVEASAVYNDYFKETFIPASPAYAFRYGENVSNREHIRAALQACYSNPSLARSIILYVLKQTGHDGMVPEYNKGFGYIPSDAYKENNIQFDVMNAVALYLEKTGDYAFLDEWVTVYPMERGELFSVMGILEKYFIFLRDRSSDSPQKSAMQAAYLPDFVHQIEKSGRASDGFMKALKDYASSAASQFSLQSDLTLAELPYVLEAQSVSNSDKRQLFEAAMQLGQVDVRSVPGLASFDGIEASALFRDTVLKEGSEEQIGEDAWSIYCYYRLME